MTPAVEHETLWSKEKTAPGDEEEKVLSVPDWLKAHILQWAQRLGLGEWEIRVRMAEVVNDDPAVFAATEQFSDMRAAALIFRADAADDAFWRTCAIHELLHVLHAPVDHCVENGICAALSARQARLAHTFYVQSYEPYTHHLARCLYRLGSENILDSPTPESLP